MANREKDVVITTRVKDLASKDLTKMGKSGKKAGQSIAAGFIKAQLALGGLKLAIKGAFRALKGITTDAAASGDEFAKMSRRLGVGIETLSALSFVADLAGTSFTGLANAMKLLAKNAFDASTGVGEAVDVFEDLDITVTDVNGVMKTADVLMLELADRFKGMTDATKKAAFAQRIFGRSGLDLIPVLNQGSDAIRAQMKEAEFLGLVWTKLTGKTAEDMVDAMARFSGSIKGVRNAIAVELMPTLIPAFENMAKKIAGSRKSIAEWVRELVKKAVPFIKKEVIPVLKDMATAAVAVAKAIASVVTGLKNMVSVELPESFFDRGFGQKELLEKLGIVPGGPTPEPSPGEEFGGPPTRLPVEEIITDAIKKPEPEPGPTIFDQFFAGMQKSVDAVRKDGENVRNFVVDLGATFSGAAMEGVSNFFNAIIDGTASAKDAFRSMVTSIIQSIQRLATQRLAVELINAIIPTPMAEGGIVTRPTLALIGEAGPEAVVPLRGRSGGGISRAGMGGFGGGDVTFNIVQQPGESSTELASRVLEKIGSSSGTRRRFRQKIGNGLIG